MVCERCWADAGGDAMRYDALVKDRNNSGNPCSPSQQCGERHTRSPHTGKCACGAYGGASDGR